MSKRMSMYLAFALVVAASRAALAEDPLPKSEGNDSFDIEPPLLIKDNIPVAQTSAVAANAPGDDPERLQAALERAKKNAAAGGRLFRAGIIAKVEMEQRALKVVRLESDLSKVLWERAEAKAAEKQARSEAGEIAKEELQNAKDTSARAEQAAKTALAARERAEVEAATLNLQRQQKLLAMGSARKSDVNRAEEKLAALMVQKN